MSTLVPGGASCVALKSHFPWRYAWDDSLLFALEYRKIFIVMTACGMIKSHSDAGNLGSVLAKPDKNDFSKL